jgi:phospholipid/cholesterol/gamma-HCH transport system substrate-binding protein
MAKNNLAELFLSGLVIVVAAGFLFFIYLGNSGPALSDYDLSVTMNSADGLKSGSDVQIAGIKVGSVSDVSFAGYKARVHLRLHDDIRIPADSTVAVVSGGTLNPSMVLGIRPGRSDTRLQPGSELAPQR